MTSALSPEVAHGLINDLADALTRVLASISGETHPPSLASTAASLARYAWQGEWVGTPETLDEALAELNVAVELLGANFMLGDGTDLFPHDAKDALKRLADAAHARHSLDNDGAMTIDWLAALAGVAEKTMRAATNPKSGNPIQVRKDGHWTLIDAPEARAWLSRRADFRPTQFVSEAGALPRLTDADSVGLELRRRFHQAGTDTDTIAEQLGLSKQGLKALQALVTGAVADAYPGLSPASLKALAERLAIPSPVDFARQAYRLIAAAHAELQLSKQLGRPD